MGRSYNYANTQEDLNYVGELFMVGATQTPFLNMVGGLDGARSKTTNSVQFPIAQPWSLGEAAQPAISESVSVTGKTPTVINRSQELNIVQIFQEAVESSYLKQSAFGQVSGLASVSTTAGQPVTNEVDFQLMAHLRKIAWDADWSFLNGTYQANANAATAAKTRGIITACASNNEVEASDAKLSKALIQALLKEMAINGAVFENMVLFANAHNRQIISDIYGYAPESRTVGGVNINQIYTDFAQIGVVYAPNVPADTILIADMNHVYPVFLPVPGKGLLFYEDKAKAGASQGGMLYGQMGIDYGPKEYHGIITGLDDGEE